jgi:ElaB/YqjD/DUF883 family membrane-anchored ribosome-binding protein
MPEETRTEGRQSCPPEGSSTDSSISRPPQIVIAVAIAAAIGGFVGALIGTRLAR